MKAKIASVSLAALLLVLAGTAYPAAGSQPPRPAPHRNEVEQWIIDQVEAGEVADLTQRFPKDEGKRALDSGFVEDLLTDALPGVKPNRIGIQIAGAVFKDPLILDNATVNHLVALNFCRFEATFACSRAHFILALQMDDNTFADTADFNGMKVGASAFFRRCVFQHGADFVSADIASQLDIRGAQFRSEKDPAVFGSIKVASTTYFNQITFRGPAQFSGACFGGQFLVNDARFQNAKSPANFNGMRVADIASFEHTVFVGGADFNRAIISGQFTADGAWFQNLDADIDFNSMKVVETAYFTHVVFSGPVDFGSATFGDQLIASDSRFENKEKTVNFNGIKVTGLASIERSVFAGPTIFGGAIIGTQFQADGARFENAGSEADFNGMRVDDIATFAPVFFAGPVNFADASFRDLVVSQADDDHTTISRFDLSRTYIRRKLALAHLHIGDLKAESLHVDGASYLTDLHVEQSADLRFDEFATLDLTGSRWPSKASRKLLLQGTNYKTIRATKDGEDSHEALLDLAGQAAYSADVYGNLEAFFARQGYNDDADKAYVANRTRERQETLHWYSSDYYASWLLEGVGYGRYPERAILACALVVALGCWLFKPTKMMPQTMENNGAEPREPRQYNRFWYSLELFLPIVELKSVDAWEPKGEHRFLRHYMRIHVLLGWILVPIALAAQSGLIK